MLKLTYNENSFNLERLDEALEDWLSKRAILALRSATNIHIEPSTASFLVPLEISHQADLEKVAKENSVELCCCDAEFVEVILKGTWLTSDAESEVGVFVTVLNKSAELLFQRLSQSKRFCHS